jgi:hypothetical protein
VVTLGCTIQLSENVLLTVHCAACGGVNSLWFRLVLHISGVCLECALARGAIRQGGIFMCCQVAPGCRTAVETGGCIHAIFVLV